MIQRGTAIWWLDVCVNCFLFTCQGTDHVAGNWSRTMACQIRIVEKYEFIISKPRDNFQQLTPCISNGSVDHNGKINDTISMFHLYSTGTNIAPLLDLNDICRLREIAWRRYRPSRGSVLLEASIGLWLLALRACVRPAIRLCVCVCVCVSVCVSRPKLLH